MLGQISWTSQKTCPLAHAEQHDADKLGSSLHSGIYIPQKENHLSFYFKFIDVCSDIYVMISSDMYGTCMYDVTIITR